MLAALEQPYGILTEMFDTSEDAPANLDGTEKFEPIAPLFWSDCLDSVMSSD
jgi:hypothetical protein